ncbi:MAG: ABC transporter ATP-binding protein [Proteobacteria bacterium]|nr:ABC transporter ATP-binding protein [Pseudomonadota bacterium]
MLEVSHLSRRYGEVVAVDDVSFRIDRNEIVGLLGHNGAGKTTIMKMLTGYLEPGDGTIRVDDLEIGRDTLAIQARIGYLPENCPVWPEMAVADYLDYQAALHGVAPERRAKAVASAVRRTALADKLSAPIHTLSRGYRQRVGVAQALLHDPDIVILDEPTNGLDPTQIRHMRELIRDLAQHAMVIVSTHILQEVQAVCDRVLILRAGKLVVDSRIDALPGSAGLVVAIEGDAADALRHLPAVSRCDLQADAGGIREYRLDAPAAAAPSIAEAVMRAGLKLHALRARRNDLETVFAEVNDEVAHG